jgi:anion-transporting  ArsA/GET3 family ATPase
MAKGARVLYLTGKGGVGKTFLAERIAANLAVLTGRVALISLGPGEAAVLAADAPLSSDEAVELHTLDDRAAMSQLLSRVVGLRLISDRLLDSRAFSAIAAGAPGVREFVAMSFVQDVASRDRYRWVVVDAPSTGHSLALLASPSRMARVARFGPAARIAREISRFVCDTRAFRLALVSTPEDLAAREAVEADNSLRGLGITPHLVIVNGIYPELAAPAQTAWLEQYSDDADVLIYLARRRRQRAVTANLISELGNVELIPRELTGGPSIDATIGDLATRLAGKA